MFHKNKEPLFELTSIYFVKTIAILVFQKEHIILGVPEKFNYLISCQLKTTEFTRSVFIFSKLSYLNLNFGIRQSKIG